MQITGLVVTPDTCGGSTAVIHFKDRMDEDSLRRLLKSNHVKYGDWLRVSDAVELTGENAAYIRGVAGKYNVPCIHDGEEVLINKTRLTEAIDAEEQGA